MPPKTQKVDETELARAWIDWLVDTRRAYLEALLRLPRKEPLRDRGASYPSMQDIFLHILDNNAWWFDSVVNGRQESHHEIKGSLSDAKMRRQAHRVARSSRRLARSLTPARLHRRFVVRGTSGDGKSFEMRMNLRTIIWHMVEEELQHRGELNALFWQQDMDAPTRSWFSSALAG